MTEEEYEELRKEDLYACPGCSPGEPCGFHEVPE